VLTHIGTLYRLQLLAVFIWINLHEKSIHSIKESRDMFELPLTTQWSPAEPLLIACNFNFPVVQQHR